MNDANNESRIPLQEDELLKIEEQPLVQQTKEEEEVTTATKDSNFLTSTTKLFFTWLFQNSSLTTIWAGYILFLGMWELWDPQDIAGAYGIRDIESGSFEAFLLLYIGIMITTTGTVLLLASMMVVERDDTASPAVDDANMNEQTATMTQQQQQHRADTSYNCCGFQCLSPLRVVGVGLLVRWIGTRFLYDSFNLEGGDDDEFDLKVTAYSMTMRGVTLMGSVLILSGSPAPATLLIARFVTTLSLAQAAFRFLYPVAATHYEYRYDVEGQGYEFTQALVKDFAMEQCFGDVLMLLLAFGARPIRAIGWSSLTYAIYIIYICWISPIDRDVLGIDKCALLQTFLLSMGFGLKFLLTS